MVPHDVSHDEVMLPAATTSAARSSTSAAGVDQGTELRDLRRELEMLGILEEYESFKKNYQQWRKGHGRGASGELTGRERSPEDEFRPDAPFHSPYPEHGVNIFRFRSLAAYCTAISSIVGSVLFAFNAGFRFWHLPSRSMKVWPNFIGGLWFIVGSYAWYFQLINMGVELDEPPVYVRFNFAPIREKTSPVSRVGVLAYLYGAVAFQVAPTLEVLQFEKLLVESHSLRYQYTIATLNMLGCIGFVLGGLCEIVENKMFRCRSACEESATWREAVWWAVLGNNVGALLFTVGCLPPLLSHAFPRIGFPENLTDLTFFTGSVTFTASSGVQLLMWKSHDFGLTLLKQLNFAKYFQRSARRRTEAGNIQVTYPEAVLSPEGAEPAQELGFSRKGVLFVFVTCWLLCVTTVDLIMENELHTDEDAGKIIRHVCITLLILIVLMMQSVTVRLPKVQPFRCAMLATRFIMLAWALDASWVLFDRTLLHKQSTDPFSVQHRTSVAVVQVALK